MNKEAVIENDDELAEVIEKEMKFVRNDLSPNTRDHQCGLIRQFLRYYENTDQDTVLWAPEFVIVTRMILQSQRPVKLRYLTDFEGEEK